MHVALCTAGRVRDGEGLQSVPARSKISQLLLRYFDGRGGRTLKPLPPSSPQCREPEEAASPGVGNNFLLGANLEIFEVALGYT